MLIAMRPMTAEEFAKLQRPPSTIRAPRRAAPPAPSEARAIEAAAVETPLPRASVFVAVPVEIPELHAMDERSIYTSLIRSAAARHSLSAKLVEAIVRVESDFNPREISDKGALGIMQLIPETGARFGVKKRELFDPTRNIAAGTAYLAWLRNRYHGDVDRMLAAYNAGEAAVDRYHGVPPYPETQEYVRRVRAELGVLQ